MTDTAGRVGAPATPAPLGAAAVEGTTGRGADATPHELAGGTAVPADGLLTTRPDTHPERRVPLPSGANMTQNQPSTSDNTSRPELSR